MKCITPVRPLWAERIEVSQKANRLLVRGEGRSSYPMLSTTSTFPIQAFSSMTKKPVHLQFANLRSVEEVLGFLRKYGSINGKLVKKVRERDARGEITGKEDLLVKEDLEDVVREQRLFRCAVRLLAHLRRKAPDRVQIRNLISSIGRLYPQNSKAEKQAKVAISALAAGLAYVDPLEPQGRKPGRRHLQRMERDEVHRKLIFAGKQRTIEAYDRRTIHSEAVRDNAISGSHGVLCYLFNRFPLHMFPSAEGGIELPSYDREGILSVLYFLLRLDYRDQHQLIKICRFCRATFKSERGDSDFCDRGCYKPYNDRERYLKKKGQEKPT
jgi:hypothetical protein